MEVLNTMQTDLIMVHKENSPSAILDSHLIFEGPEWNSIATQVNEPYK